MIPASALPWIATLHLAATLYMVGLIWFVQRVHYPLFAAVGRDAFSGYERTHVARTGPVVGPAMIAEALLALALLATPDVPRAATLAGMTLLAVIWGSTAILQVPSHGILSGGFDQRAHARLVASNWIRTAAWTLRGGLAIWIAHGAG